MRKYLLVGIILILFVGIGFWLYEDSTGDFRIKNITYDLEHHPEWDIPALSASQEAWLDKVLNQKFTWIGHGHQVFVFGSEDGNYVLKIFKFKRLKPSQLRNCLSYLPPFKNYCAAEESKRARRFFKLFNGYHTAYMLDSKYTGMHYVHLNHSTNLKKTVTIIDRLGVAHNINMDRTIFAIQDRAIKTKEWLSNLLEKGKVEKAKQALLALLDMYVSEYRLGIFDHDHNIMHNTGFVDNRPIRLDTGQLRHDESIKDPERYRLDLLNIVQKRIEPWLLTHHPEAHEEIMIAIKEKTENRN